MLKKIFSVLVLALFLFAETASATEVSQDFSDVPTNSPYYKAVRWACSEGITFGKDTTHFSPAGTCSRGEALTFLWRYCGSPDDSFSSLFKDVPDGHYFQKAANWAFLNGYEPGELERGEWYFKGDTPCTRIAAITYLWNMAGRPSVNLDTVRMFQDIQPDSSLESVTSLQAVAWAVQQGITNGTTPTAFSPDKACTRGQIVTFMYRYYRKTE